MDDGAAIRHHRRMSRARLEYIGVVLLLACSAAHASGDSVRAFARAPAFAYATLSPSGTLVSFVEQIDSRQVVMMRALAGGDPQPTLSVQPPHERVRWCGWADERYVLCGTVVTARKQHGVFESTKLYSIDAVSHRVLELSVRLQAGARDQVIDLTPAQPRSVLLQQDPAGRGFPEVVELDVATGETRSRVRAHPPVRSWMSDGRGEIRLGLAYEQRTARLFVPKDGEWVAVLEQSLSDPAAIGPLAFGERASQLYVLKHYRGRAALYRWDIGDSGAATLLFADPMFDVSGPLVLHPTTRELLAVRYQAESPSIHLFAAAERELHAWLDRELPNAVNEITARSLDGLRLLVTSSADTNPPSVYFVDAASQRIELLAHQFPELERRPLAPMRAFMYSARDGQRIPAYLTQPIGRDTPGPAIVLPHGGPETRDVRKFDALVQFLVSQGYAVLQMNYRGSQGYGAGFAAAGAQQWGGVIHNDITDGARWLVEQRIADAARLCIVGTSFGGYAALLGAARESQWYACAASFGGATDLLAFAEFTRRLPEADMWRERLGDDGRALWQMSPLALERRIETPVLLMHGRRDAVVPISQSRRLARALRSAGKEHRLVERSDCDHDMTGDSCRVAIFAALGDFLRQILHSDERH